TATRDAPSWIELRLQAEDRTPDAPVDGASFSTAPAAGGTCGSGGDLGWLGLAARLRRCQLRLGLLGPGLDQDPGHNGPDQDSRCANREAGAQLGHECLATGRHDLRGGVMSTET